MLILAKSILGLMIGFFLSVILGLFLIPVLRKLKCGQTISSFVAFRHQRHWKAQFKSFNLGLPLGDASGYCGIDVDGEEGIKLLLEMSNGDLPGTWEFSTGAGSRLLYLIPDGMKTKKFKQTGNGAHQECALLCNGQQTIMPPSIHHSGRVYEWIEGHSPWDMDCAMAPAWLLAKIELKDEGFGFNMNLNLDSPNSENSNASVEFDLDDEFESSGDYNKHGPHGAGGKGGNGDGKDGNQQGGI